MRSLFFFVPAQSSQGILVCSRLINVSAQETLCVRQFVNGFPDAIPFGDCFANAFWESAKEANGFLKVAVILNRWFAEERSQRGRPFLFLSFKDDVAMFVIVNQLPNSVALSLIPPTVGNAPESGDDGSRSVAQIIAFANLPQRFQSCLVNDVLGFRVIGPAQMLP